MTVAKSFEYLDDMGGQAPFRTLYDNCYIEFAVKGGFKVIISYKTHPKDQMSDQKS